MSTTWAGRFCQYESYKESVMPYCAGAVVRGYNPGQSASSTEFENGAITVQFGVVVQIRSKGARSVPPVYGVSNAQR